jgi:hypothetical protein
VDEQEADYLRQRNRELEAAVARWRAVALTACAAFLAIIFAAAVGGVLLGQFWVRQAEVEMEARDRAEEAMVMEREAREEADQARRAADDARRQVELPQPGPVEQVAGGLGLAALAP